MAVLTVQDLVITGLTPTFGAAAAGGDQFANDGKTFFYVKNGGGGTVNVTVNSQVANPPAGTAVANQAVAVAAGVDKLIGPFTQSAWNNANGEVVVAYDQVTSVTVAAIKLKE